MSESQAVSGSLFRQVSREPRLSDKVAEMMLETILSRRLKPGDRLPSERELGEQFGVSRTVVREAVRALAAKGVIEVRSGSGLRVAAVAPSTVSESMGLFLHGATLDYLKVHEIRAMLEVQMAGAAAERATDEDVASMTEACERMEAVVDDVEAAALADVEFHRAIARSTHNELYLVLLDAIGDALVEIRRANLAVPHVGSETIAAHRRILERIQTRDAEGARAAMSAHLQHVQNVWSARTAEQSESSPPGEGGAQWPR